jgi:hypothetical protein
MGNRAGFIVDLSTVQLSEGDHPQSWIQAMTLGTYNHPVYGEIKLTPERVKRFAANVTNKVRETDLDIDYDHKMASGEAAGWIQAAEARQDGLFVLVEWTKAAALKIKDKAYRYFSPEFTDEWEHPKTGGKYQDVLLGGGITNRPFLKDILPVNLSELVGHGDPPEPPQGGAQEVDLKKLSVLLGLKEDSDDAVVEAKVKELITKLSDLPPPPDPVAEVNKKLRETLGMPVDATDEQVNAKLAELKVGKPTPPIDVVPDDLKELFDANPHIKSLVENFQASQQKLQEHQAALRLAEVDRDVAKLNLKEGRRIRLTPAFMEKAREVLLMVKGEEESKSVYSLLQMVVEGKSLFFEIGEYGKSRNNFEANPQKEFPEAITRKMKENDKLSYGDAAKLVAAERPSLFEEYTASMRGGE